MKRIINYLLVITVSYVIMSVLHTHGKFILFEYFVYYLWFIPPVFLMEIFLRRYKVKAENEEGISNLIPGLILFIFLLLALCSSLNHHKWFYFLRWRHAPVAGFHYFDAGFIRFILLSQFLLLIFLFSKRKISLIAALMILVVLILCFGAFILETKGEPIYRDDHSCFIYRIWEFTRTFPQFLNYNPGWNAGFYGCSGVETGAVSLGALFFPLWKIAQVESVYTYAIAVLFIFVVPLLFVFSIRVIGGDWLSAWCAGILSLGVSQHYFLWLFQYGTPGALLTAALLVPFASCVFRVVWIGKMGWRLAIALVLSAFFLVMWPPGVIMGLTVVIPFVLSFRKWSVKKILFLALCFSVFFVLWFKIFMAIIQPDMMSGIAQGFDFCGKGFSCIKGWMELGCHIMEGNPILIFFGLGGIFFLAQKDIRYWFMPILFAMIFITGWGDEINSDIQLQRFSIPMFFVSVVPASLWLGRFLKIKNVRFALVQGSLLALLLVGGWNCVQMYRNCGLVRYITMPQDIKDLIGWIKKNVPNDGRVLLAGPTLHAYGGGHAVVLPYLTEREMLASDFVQFSRDASYAHFPPPEFLVSKEKLFDYMELYNITHVIVWEEDYKNIFRKYPKQYIEESTIGDKTIFRVERKSDLFLKGRGSIEADFNLLKVHTDAVDEDIVIKYNWLEGLYSDDPVKIFPYDAGDGIRFIGIHPCGQKDIVIRFKK